MRWALSLLLLLGGCGSGQGEPAAAPTQTLEQAALAAGLVADPAKADPTGLYARDTDRLCLVPAGDRFRVGVTIRFDERQGCLGRGTATRSGDALDIELPNCRIAASYDGQRIVFPANLPEGCSALCSDRATMSALEVEQLSASAAEAATLRDEGGRLLCSS